MYFMGFSILVPTKLSDPILWWGEVLGPRRYRKTRPHTHVSH